MILTVRKYRATSQLILLFLAWVWVIVMSILEKDVQLSINGVEPFSKIVLALWPAHSIGNLIFDIIIVLLEALYLAYIFQKHNLTERNNWIPSILYLVLAGASGSYSLSPAMLSNFFILLTIDRLFESYESNQSVDDILLASIYTSIAVLFYFPSIIFIVGIWAGLFILRNLNWRYFVASFIGLITPFLYLGTWFFINNQLRVEANLYYSVFKKSLFHIKDEKIINLVIFSATLLILLISIFYLILHQQGKLVKIRKKTSIVVTLSILSAIAVFISYETIQQSLMALVLILSGAASIQISEMKSNTTSTILFWFLLLFYAIVNLRIF